MAKKNFRPTAPDASGVVNVFLVMTASDSDISLWGTLGQLQIVRDQYLSWDVVVVDDLTASLPRLVVVGSQRWLQHRPPSAVVDTGELCG